MNNNLYTVYDRVAQESGPLFEAKNDLVAWRMVLSANLPIAPNEFDLMCLGSYSHDPVMISLFEKPIVVNKASTFVEEVDHETIASR